MKNKIIFLFLFLTVAVVSSAYAQTEINDLYFYDSLSGVSCFFGTADTSDKEVGVSLTDTEGKETRYKARYTSEDGKYAILLKDKDAVLSDRYTVRAYSLKNGEYTYSSKSVSFNPGIIYANPFNVSEIASNAKSGDVIVLEDGVYNDINVNINSSGTEEMPIVFKSCSDSVEFTGSSKITVSGSFVTVSGIYFNTCVNPDSVVVAFTDCTKSRLTESYFYRCGSNPTSVVISLGKSAVNCRVDNNFIEDSRAMSIQVSCGSLSDNTTAALNNRIDHNYFYDIHKVSEYYSASNGFECIQTGTYEGNVKSLGTIVEYNRFEKIVGDSSEIISNKSNGNIFRYNTFINCPSSPTIRKGNDCVFEGNYLLGVSKGMRFYGSGHKITDNYFFKSGSIFSDTGNNGNDGYLRQENSLIKDNIIVNPTNHAFVEGRNFDTMKLYYKLPKNVSIESNFLWLDNKKAVFKHISDNNISYKKNEVVLNGASEIGDADNGFIEVDTKLHKKNGILVPESEAVDMKGLITLSSLKNRYITKRVSADDIYSLSEPDETPVSYSIYSSEDYRLCAGDTFNLRSLSGTATYKNGKTYSVPSEDVEFTFSTQAYITRTGDVITLKNKDTVMHSFYIYATYKGITSSRKVYVYPKASANSETGDMFDEDDGFEIFNITGTGALWGVDNGALITKGIQNSIITLVGYTHDADNFEFQCDITVTEAEGYQPDVSFVYGYSNFGRRTPLKIRLTEGGGMYSDSEDARIGELNKSIVPGKKQHLRIIKNGDIIVATLDGDIISVSELATSTYGKFGFHVANTHIRVENIDIFEREYSTSEISEIPVSYERIDEEIIKLSFIPPYDDCIYKIYKNGEYSGICSSKEYYTDIEAYVGEIQEYIVEGYNQEGVLKASGRLCIKLESSEENEFFRITDVLSRNGNNGEYVEYYTSENRFLQAGSFPYCDRPYIYTEVGEEFYDCGYIATGNNDRNNTEFILQNDDWMKFKINRSATVYVVFHKILKTPPGWLSGWAVKEDTALSINNSIGTAVIYYKHFNVADGDKLEITLGGHRSLSSMYQVIVKPDIMPEMVSIKRKF